MISFFFVWKRIVRARTCADLRPPRLSVTLTEEPCQARRGRLHQLPAQSSSPGCWRAVVFDTNRRLIRALEEKQTQKMGKQQKKWIDKSIFQLFFI